MTKKIIIVILAVVVFCLSNIASFKFGQKTSDFNNNAYYTRRIKILTMLIVERINENGDNLSLKNDLIKFNQGFPITYEYRPDFNKLIDDLNVKDKKIKYINW